MAAAERRKSFAPGRLWSLWDMLRLEVNPFFSGLSRFSKIAQGFTMLQQFSPGGKLASANFSTEQFNEFRNDIDSFCDACKVLELEITLEAVNRLRNLISNIKIDPSGEHFHIDQMSFQSIRSLGDDIINRAKDELNTRLLLVIQSRLAKYYKQTDPLFGGGVFSKFPSANDDIYEAGMCLAFERATACVMHLNRVLEIGLAALAKTIGVARQNDWGAYLREIEQELDKRAKTSGARSADEQFYAAAAANFDRLRRAYRNPTMHPEKTYSTEQAEDIFLATKSFMSHLAARISE